jgi:hypothetical protein
MTATKTTTFDRKAIMDRAHFMARLRIPTQAGRGYRFEAGQGSDLMPATVPR